MQFVLQGGPTALECLRNARFLQGQIGPFWSLDLVIDHELTVVYETMPNLVIALALTNECAIMFTKDALDAWRVILCHLSHACEFRTFGFDLEWQWPSRYKAVLFK